MAIGDPYATLPELKEYLGQQGATANDDSLTDALQSVSEEIENHCNRQFNTDNVATARRYEPRDFKTVLVDDFHTEVGLIVETDSGGTGSFDIQFDSSQYELFPTDGIVSGQPGWPFNKVRAVSGLYFPKYANQPWRRKAVVRVTAQWGWASVPAPVKQACLIMAAETWTLKNAPFGVAGVNQFGGVLRVRENPMAASKLARYVRDPIMVG